MTGTVEDLPRTGRPKTTTSEEKIEEVSELLKNNLGMSLKRASNITNISYDSARKIAKEIVGLHP